VLRTSPELREAGRLMEDALALADSYNRERNWDLSPVGRRALR
jgi:hypothetical protein